MLPLGHTIHTNTEIKVNRARDSPDDEEKEILSSTSSNVREIWDGNRVVRQTGESKTIPFVYNSKEKSLKALWNHPRFISPSPKSLKDSGLVWYALMNVIPRTLLHIKRPESGPLPPNISPNLTLNTPAGVPTKTMVGFLAFTGLLIQSAVVVFNAFAVYHWQWLKSGKPIERFAYPLWAAGTAAITIGVWLCGWVVESSSEKLLVTGDGGSIGLPVLDENDLRIIFMQQKLPAQNIPAYSIEPIPIGKKMIYSRRLWPPTADDNPSAQINSTWRDRENRVRVACVAIGTLLTLLGFVGQNIGTRSLHWSAGLLQLGATAALTTLRAVIRRNVGRLVDDKSTNTIEKLDSDFEACHLSTKLIGFEVCLAYAPITVREPTARSEDQYFWAILDIDEIDILLGNDDGDSLKTIISEVLEAQILVTRYVPEMECIRKAAASCLKAMDEILNLILPGHKAAVWEDLGAFLWIAVRSLEKGAAASTTIPKFRLIGAPTRSDKRLSLLEAVLSSTRYTYREEGKTRRPVFRILGDCAKKDVKSRRQLLSAWVEPHHNPGELSRVCISHPLEPTTTEAEVPRGHYRERAILFGLPLSHGFRNAM